MSRSLSCELGVEGHDAFGEGVMQHHGKWVLMATQILLAGLDMLCMLRRGSSALGPSRIVAHGSACCNVLAGHIR